LQAVLPGGPGCRQPARGSRRGRCADRARQAADDIFSHAPKLQACVRHRVGLDFIPVANLPAANRQAVVEYVVGTAVLLARDLHRLVADFRGEG
jgi:phosphoglycerate dehydrogenase-like enzyme